MPRGVLPGGLAALLLAAAGSAAPEKSPTTGRDTLVTRIVQPYGVVLTPSGGLYSTSESRVVRVESGG